MTKPYNLNRLAYFAAVVETGSFTNAAARLGVTKAVVSSQITHLEQEVQTTLLVRNTRKVSATQAGEVFYRRCASILNEAEDAFSELSQLSERPVGTLRITAPNDYGTAIVTPLAAAFRRTYPDCQITLSLADELSDLMSGKLDLAIRVGWLRDSGLVARKMGVFKQLLVGPVKEKTRLDKIDRPRALSGLDFIANASLPDPLKWQFENNAGQRASVKLTSHLSIDSAPAIMQAVKDGAGLAILPDYLVRDEIGAGGLQHVLPEWQLPEGGIYAVLPATNFRAAKVTAFLDMLQLAEKGRSVD